MKRTLIILTISITSLGLGYWIGQMKTFADGVVEDIGKYELKTDSGGRIIDKEDFGVFIYKFIADSSFQLTRIKFPLKSMRLSVPSGNESFPGPDSVLVLIEKTAWKVIGLFEGEQNIVQIHDTFKKEIRDTDERLFVWEQINNGINIGNSMECKFSRIDGRWYLTEYNDYRF